MSSSSLFITFLLRDYAKLLESAEDHDTTIKVVKDDNSKVFRAHSVILRSRSLYFQKVLSKENINLLAAELRSNGNPKPRKPKVTSITMENISPFAFETLLRYMYIGTLEYENYKALDVLDILTTANQLGLAELVDILQDYLIERKTGWLQMNFAATYNAAFRQPSLPKLQKFCNKIIDKSPATILRALDFNNLAPDFVVSLLEREDLVELEEIHIWNKLIEWGIAQTPYLPADISEWSSAEFIILRTTLRPFFPLVRYLDISPEDFDERVKPYQPIFPNQLYLDITKVHSDPEYKPLTSILPSRAPSFKINSVLINPKHAAWLASCINRKDEDSLIENGETDEITTIGATTYEFKLLLRGSRDGFTPEEFHRLCDKQGPTITVIKVNETGQLIGGYNPFSWLSHNPIKWNKTSDSFIFSLGDDNLNDAILSRVENPEYAICQDATEGPSFGVDIVLRGDFKEPKQCYCNKNIYEYSIMKGADHAQVYFAIEEYEIFQVIKKRA
ncbi:4485_t:CDS:2 [Ambispora leptoticha]|uniref:4485_t:CDS:1 n=1 Tax=Ambispora leptoticha TaxID=144679 RepID=A0A9N9FCP6_9GLOM|nr:4485_t:CDS:2 [Ambispora leptoticha]